MSEPDWDRYLDVDSRAGDQAGGRHSYTGDPTRWAAEVSVDVPLLFGGIIRSPQVVRVQIEDPYPRVFSLFGSVDMPNEYWATADDAITTVLEMVAGAGQVSFPAVINIRAIMSSQFGGLFLQSPLETDLLAPGLSRSVPFVLPGPILIARAASYRLAVRFNVAAPVAGRIRLALMTANISGGRL